MDEGIEDKYELMLQHRDEQERDPWNQFIETLEGYCDYCEVAGHTFRTCPRRDDNESWDESVELSSEDDPFDIDAIRLLDDVAEGLYG